MRCDPSIVQQGKIAGLWLVALAMPPGTRMASAKVRNHGQGRPMQSDGCEKNERGAVQQKTGLAHVHRQDDMIQNDVGPNLSCNRRQYQWVWGKRYYQGKPYTRQTGTHTTQGRTSAVATEGNHGGDCLFGSLATFASMPLPWRIGGLQ